MIPIVGFYTENSPYEQEAEKMEESAIQVGLENITLYSIPHQGSWEQNCGMKPSVLLQAAEELKRPFLYVDVDARFCSYPHLFDNDWTHYGLGAHYFRGVELLSGTLWINPTADTIKLLQYWKEQCVLHPNTWDQKLLQKVVKAAYGVKGILQLPPEYTFINDLSRRVYGPGISPVIAHFQASRKYKSVMKGNCYGKKA